MARNDITLGVGVDLRGIDATGRRIHHVLSQAGGASGRSAADLFTKEYAKKMSLNEAPIRKAYERVVVSISRQSELMQKLRGQQVVTAESARTLARENRLLSDAQNDTSVTADRLAQAQDRARQASVDHSSEMSKQISLHSQLTRANNQHSSSLMNVSLAQSKVIENATNDMSLLTAGKYLSAIRAVGIPAAYSQVFAIVVQLAAAAAAASQAILLIPAAATAVGAAVGTMKLATAGFGDAIKDIGDAEKFAAALQNLSPNAQQAALSIQALMEPLTELRTATQDALFLNFGPMINQVTNEFLPMVQALTTGIAGAFNLFATKLSETLSTAGVQASLGAIVNNIVAAFQNLAPAVNPLIKAFTKLTEVGSGVLPEIATAAVNAANSFANFIDAAAQSGQLERWLRGGLEAVSQIWNGLFALGKAFMALAPVGERVLPDIVKVLEKMEPLMIPIAFAAGLIGINFGTVSLAAKAAEKAIEGLKAVAILTARAIEMAMRVIGPAIDAALLPVRNTITLINASPIGRLLGSNAPQIPAGVGRAAAGGLGGLAGGLADYYSQTPLTQRGPGQFRRQGGSSGRGSGTVGETTAPFNPFAAANLPPFPSGGYTVPAPPPAGGAGGSSASDAPPFTADPSLYSVDAIPVTPSGITIPDITRANTQIDALAAIAAMAPFNLQNASDVRNEPGSFHHTGQAGDFSNSSGPTPEMHAFATYLAQNFGHLIEQLIYSDPVRGDVLIGGGQMVGPGTSQPNYYDANTRAQHKNHVHVAVTDAMAPYLQAALSGNTFGGTAGGGAGYFEKDQQAIFDAESALLRSKNDVEQKRLRLLQLESDGNATQLQLLTAKNDVDEAHRAYLSNETKLAEAQQGKFKKLDQAVTGAASQVASSMGEIGAELAGDFGLSEGLPGIAKFLTTALANMAFAPMMGSLAAISASSPVQGGHGMFGMMGAQNMAAGGSPLGLSMPPMPGAAIPPMMPGPAMPGTGIPPMMPGPMPSMMGPAPLGGGMHGGSGGAPPGPTSMSPGGSLGGGGFAGIGGLPLEAAMTATAGLDLLAPGASQAAQVGMKLANRAAGFAGQVAGIGVGGLLETFLPNNSSTADPSKSWIGKIASGVAGARPALPNSAGSAPAQPPMPQQGGGQGGGPMVNIESMINQTPDGGQEIANTVGRMQMSAYGAGGPR